MALTGQQLWAVSLQSPRGTKKSEETVHFHHKIPEFSALCIPISTHTAMTEQSQNPLVSRAQPASDPKRTAWQCSGPIQRFIPHLAMFVQRGQGDACSPYQVIFSTLPFNKCVLPWWSARKILSLVQMRKTTVLNTVSHLRRSVFGTLPT